MELVSFVLHSVASIQLPFGFDFGHFLLFCWSIPLLFRFFKSIF